MQQVLRELNENCGKQNNDRKKQLSGMTKEKKTPLLLSSIGKITSATASMKDLKFEEPSSHDCFFCKSPESRFFIFWPKKLRLFLSSSQQKVRSWFYAKNGGTGFETRLLYCRFLVLVAHCTKNVVNV